MVGVHRPPQRDHHFPCSRKTPHELLAHALELVRAHVTVCRCGVEALRLYAEHLLGVLLVAEYHVASFHQRGHHLSRRLAVFPQVFPVVKVARHGHSPSVCLFYSLQTHVSRALTDGRRYAGPVKPLRAFHHLVPVYHSRLYLRHGGVSPVINHLARSRHRACLQKIYSHARAAVYYVVCLHPMLAQVSYACLRYVVFGQACDELHVHAIVCQRHRHISLSASESGAQQVCLTEPQVSRSGETQHYLSESHNLCHMCLCLYMYVQKLK